MENIVLTKTRLEKNNKYHKKMSKKIPPAVANAIIDGALDLIPDTEPKTKGGKIMRVVKKVGKIFFTFVKIK